MKKSTLLVVMAILVVGIQGCSTEESGIENEILTSFHDEEASKSNFNDPRRNLVVYFSEYLDESAMDHIKYYLEKDLPRAPFYLDISTNCETKEKWLMTDLESQHLNPTFYIPNFTLGKYVASAESDEVEDEGDLDNEGKLISKIDIPGGYTFKIYFFDNLPSSTCD